MMWPVWWRSAATAVAIFSIVFSIDFANRVVVLRDASLRVVIQPKIIFFVPPPAMEKIRAQMNEWVPYPQNTAGSVRRELFLQAVIASDSVLRAVIVIGETRERAISRSTVRVGEEVDGWKITAIEARRVQLTRDGRLKELILFKRS